MASLFRTWPNAYALIWHLSHTEARLLRRDAFGAAYTMAAVINAHPGVGHELCVAILIFPTVVVPYDLPASTLIHNTLPLPLCDIV